MPEIIDNLACLISYPTVSRDSNIELIKFLEKEFSHYGANCYVQYNKEKNKANLVAAFGPETEPGIVLAGHSDVVPTEGQDWSHDPFEAYVKDNRLYGRGACDMKGFIAAILTCLSKISETKLSRPLYILITYDEEVGCGGAKQLMADVKSFIPTKPLACIVGEPTLLKIVDAHKGMKLFKTVCEGKPAHSSLPEQGSSAAFTASRLMMFLEDFMKTQRINHKTSNATLGFSSPYTTINVGKVTGGSAVNIIPERCELIWECRYISNTDARQLTHSFENFCNKLETNCTHESFIKNTKINTEEYSMIPSLTPSEGSALPSDLDRLLRRITNSSNEQVNYCTEAGIYQAAFSCPTVICGPGSIEQAHKADEFVDLDQLDKAMMLIHSLITYCTEEMSAGVIACD
ncbi:acetylornithine deacetylase [Cysteiniphilum halobium]|uniref:acetylornithine deacetylase n=1 Tax=Cysteiniphilum halobium TaxID=2219059 RepID=UPI003F85922E